MHAWWVNKPRFRIIKLSVLILYTFDGFMGVDEAWLFPVCSLSAGYYG